MGDFIRYDVREVDLNKPLWRTQTGVLLAMGDDGANRFGAILHRDGVPVDFAGKAVAVTGYFMRPDGETLVCKGAQNGSMVYVDLPAACYTQSGTFSLAVKVSSTDVTETVRVIDGVIRLTQTDTIVDPGEVVPSLDDLLAHIAEMEAVASSAAPPIVPEITAEVVEVNDALERKALSVTSIIEPVPANDGVPSPDNVIPLSPRPTVSLWHGAAYDETAAAALTTSLPDGVYGGKLDWVTGVLTVTHKNVTLTGTGTAWTYGSSNIATRVNDRAANATLYSDRYVHNTSSLPTALAANEMCLGKNYNNVCFGNPGNAMTIDAWRTLRDAEPLQLVYELAAPTTVQLTAQQIAMLKGSNVFWSDSGDTVVAYVADTKAYIDNKFSALQNAILSQGANI